MWKCRGSKSCCDESDFRGEADRENRRLDGPDGIVVRVVFVPLFRFYYVLFYYGGDGVDGVRVWWGRMYPANQNRTAATKNQGCGQLPLLLLFSVLGLRLNKGVACYSNCLHELR